MIDCPAEQNAVNEDLHRRQKSFFWRSHDSIHVSSAAAGNFPFSKKVGQIGEYVLSQQDVDNKFITTTAAAFVII